MKPDNILLTEKLDVKICDFGLSQVGWALALAGVQRRAAQSGRVRPSVGGLLGAGDVDQLLALAHRRFDS